MPVQTLRIRFACVTVLDDSDLMGDGEWHLYASVDGNRVGNPETEFSVTTNQFVPLPDQDWSCIVDVSNHSEGDSVQIRFKVVERDVFSDDDLGTVRATLHYPYAEPFRDIFLESPLLSGGLFQSDYRCYRLLVLAIHNDEVASTGGGGPTRIPVTRTSQGGTTFNTVRGEAFVPRVDIHPVIPVPQPPSHIPRPLRIPAGMAPAQVTPAARVTVAPSAPTLNALPNPSVIPILSATDPDLNNRVANLSVTAYQPGNLDTSKLFWRVASGPAAIVGTNTGLSIKARGTGNSPTDQIAVFEIHWQNAAGPLLATYRAWVGKLGTLKYRVNRLNGRSESGSGSGTPAPYPVRTLMPDERINAIMKVVQAIHFQAGILLIPDDDTTGWEGATHSRDAIFDLTVTNNQHTNNVSHEVISRATAYNFRPGVINFAIVFSTAAGNAAAVDRNGIEGKPDSGKSMADNNQYTYNGSGVEKKLGGSPSSSWIKPAGVGRDGAGVEQTIKTIYPTDRYNQARRYDRDFVAARRGVDATFTDRKMRELYACQVPAQWGLSVTTVNPSATPPASLSEYVWRCAINFAHELGHVLGLAHRGSGGNSTGPSADKMQFTEPSGSPRGHPWQENVMTYGYVGMDPPLAHDIDLIQAMVVRRHPAIRY